MHLSKMFEMNIELENILREPSVKEERKPKKKPVLPVCWNGLMLNAKDGIKIIVGPVIGLVTDSSARILVETETACNLVCTLVGQNKEVGDILHKVSLTLQMKPLHPNVFIFRDLLPNQTYAVLFDVPPRLLAGSRFTTLPYCLKLEQHPFFMAVMNNKSESCNSEGSVGLWQKLKERRTAENQIWKDLYETSVRKPYHVLLHFSDSVTDKSTWKKVFDEAYTICQNTIDFIDAYRKICQLFQTVFRAAFTSNTWIRHTLANSSNIPIISQSGLPYGFDAGDREIYPNPSFRHFVLCCAYDVYGLYRRQLCSNFQLDYGAAINFWTDTPNILLSNHKFYCIGDVGFLLLDTITEQRQIQETHEKKRHPILGDKQWNDIEKALNQKGGLSTVKHLIVGCADSPADADSIWWSTSETQAECKKLLNKLFLWTYEAPKGYRNVILITNKEPKLRDIAPVGYKDIDKQGIREVQVGALPLELRNKYRLPIINYIPFCITYPQKKVEKLKESENKKPESSTFSVSDPVSFNKMTKGRKIKVKGRVEGQFEKVVQRNLPPKEQFTFEIDEDSQDTPCSSTSSTETFSSFTTGDFDTSSESSISDENNSEKQTLATVVFKAVEEQPSYACLKLYTELTVPTTPEEANCTLSHFKSYVSKPIFEVKFIYSSKYTIKDTPEVSNSLHTPILSNRHCNKCFGSENSEPPLIEAGIGLNSQRDIRIIIWNSQSCADLSDFLQSIPQNDTINCPNNPSPLLSRGRISRDSTPNASLSSLPSTASHDTIPNISQQQSWQQVDPYNQGTRTISVLSGASIHSRESLASCDLEENNDLNTDFPPVMLNWDSARSRGNSLQDGTRHHKPSDVSDWFNYGFTEETFKRWLEWQLAMRRKRCSNNITQVH